MSEIFWTAFWLVVWFAGTIFIITLLMRFNYRIGKLSPFRWVSKMWDWAYDKNKEDEMKDKMNRRSPEDMGEDLREDDE